MNYATVIKDVTGAAALSLKSLLPRTFSLAPGSVRSDEAWRSQWQPISLRAPPNGGWNWPSYRLAKTRDPTRFCAAMWCGNEQELCGLTLMRLNKTACWIDMFEGSPAPHHPIKGLVPLIALELGTMYAQAAGRREVWICRPSNVLLLQYYLDIYGFKLASPKKGETFCRREI
jgi:hypothetical protein